jgi:DNA helicase-2/ATP-dependent DNA helicase PcrA
MLFSRDMKYNHEQNRIIKDDSKYIQVIAGAGSGKTATMIGYVEEMIKGRRIDPAKILILSFSRKAASEFRERIESRMPGIKIRIQTFHAYCFQVLKEHHPDFRDNPPGILTEEEKNKILKSLYRKNKFIIGGIPFSVLSENPLIMRTLFPELEQERREMIEKYKAENQKLEFSDLIEILLNGLKNKEAWTENPRMESRYLIVDEFQDTDPDQLEFMSLIDPTQVVVVGDDWQAIYGFRGATLEPFLNFGSYFSPLSQHFLVTNYRSKKDIVSISSLPIERNHKYIPKKIKSGRKEAGFVKLLRYSEGETGQFELNQDWGYLCLRNKSIEKKQTSQGPKSGSEKRQNGKNNLTLPEMQISKSKENRTSDPIPWDLSDYRILCRTNYRIAEFQRMGFPAENLLTIHASKGLEFDTVFVDLLGGWGKLNPGDLNPEYLDEERRILYVALSRAKNNLIIWGKKNLSPKRNLEDLLFTYLLPKSIWKIPGYAA